MGQRAHAPAPGGDADDAHARARRVDQGGFGQVMRVRNKLDGREYAIKRVRLDRKDAEYNRRYLREVTTLSQLHHDYVVRCARPPAALPPGLSFG
jgi:hypothetical protein